MMPLARSVRNAFSRIPGSFWVLAALFIVCAIFVPRFFTATNFSNVLRVAAILALATYGQTIVIILSGVEFSIGSSVAVGSIVTVLALQSYGAAAAFGAGFVTMVLVGAVNGLLVTFAKLPPLLATLGMLMFLHGVGSVAIGGLPVEAPASEAFQWLGRGHLFGISVPIVLAAVCGLLLHFLLDRTTLGRTFYLIGSNERAARLAGISVNRNIWAGYTIAAGFVALAGLVLTSRVASGQPNLMPTLPFETISACAIGGISLLGGRGNAAQALFGVLIVAILNNAIVLLNLPTSIQLVSLGTAMVLAVVLQQDAHALWHRLLILRSRTSNTGAPMQTDQLGASLLKGLKAEAKKALGVTLLLALAAALFSGLLPNFGTMDNARSLLAQFSPLAMLALGQMCVILIGGFDISVGAVMALSSVVAALATHQFGLSGLALAPAVGLLFGLVNGVIVSVLRVQPIISTLGTMLVARGIASLASNNGQVVLVSPDASGPLLAFNYGETFGLPNTAIATIAVFVACWWLLSFTRWGRRFFLVGGNANAAGLVGIPVVRTTVSAYALCGLMAGLASLLLLARTGTGLPTDGAGSELQSIAAAVIGGTQLSGGVANPFAVLLSALFIQTINSALSFSGISPYAGEIAMGLVILIAGSADQLSHRLSFFNATKRKI